MVKIKIFDQRITNKTFIIIILLTYILVPILIMNNNYLFEIKFYILTIIGNVKGLIEMQCSRCLEIFSHNIDLDIFEEFTNNSDKEDDSIAFFEDNLYLSEVIVNNVISTLPIKKLCNENCKGLCHECGTNLNLGTCNCNSDNIDIRMAKLMDLFKE